MYEGAKAGAWLAADGGNSSGSEIHHLLDDGAEPSAPIRRAGGNHLAGQLDEPQGMGGNWADYIAFNECNRKGAPHGHTYFRNLDNSLKAKLRLSAARHSCSMEEEARRILRRALIPQEETGLGSRIHEKFGLLGGVEEDLPVRSMPRPAPNFERGNG